MQTMRAIITNISKKSAYHKFTGLTFDVTDIAADERRIALTLSIGGNKVKFGASEVTLVDFQVEQELAFDMSKACPTSENMQKYLCLRLYAQAKGISCEVDSEEIFYL